MRLCRQRLVGRQRDWSSAAWRSAALPFLRTQLRLLGNVKYARIDADRLTVGERDSELPVAMQDEATIDVGGGKVRIDLDGLIEIGNRPLMATSLVPDQAAVAVEMGVSEAESDRPIQVDECLIKRPFALPQDCPVVEYGGVV